MCAYCSDKCGYSITRANLFFLEQNKHVDDKYISPLLRFQFNISFKLSLKIIYIDVLPKVRRAVAVPARTGIRLFSLDSSMLCRNSDIIPEKDIDDMTL